MADLIELQSVCGVFFMKDATQQKTQIVTEIFRHLACFNKSKFKSIYCCSHNHDTNFTPQTVSAGIASKRSNSHATRLMRVARQQQIP
jgi:hypothetical protein